MLCVFSMIVPSYIIQEQGIARRFYNLMTSNIVAILRVTFQETIKILTGSTKYQDIDGYFWIMLCILK